jgi:hypothetical protein
LPTSTSRLEGEIIFILVTWGVCRTGHDKTGQQQQGKAGGSGVIISAVQGSCAGMTTTEQQRGVCARQLCWADTQAADGWITLLTHTHLAVNDLHGQVKLLDHAQRDGTTAGLCRSGRQQQQAGKAGTGQTARTAVSSSGVVTDICVAIADDKPLHDSVTPQRFLNV